MGSEEVIVRAKFGYQIYANDGFNICRYEYIEKPTNAARKAFIAKGRDLPVLKDVVAVLHGSWVPGKDGGYDLAVTCYETELPSEQQGIVNYICSLHCGVGASKATSLYNKYGERTWFILQNQPERIQELGWSMSLIRKLCAALYKTQVQSQIMQLFGNISYRQADKLAKSLGANAVMILKSTPYTACQVPGFSFAMVDSMAMKLGIDPTNIERRKAAASSALDTLSVSGHTCVPRDTLVKKMMAILNPTSGTRVVTEDMCQSAIVCALGEKQLANVKGIIYSRARYIEERRIVKDIARLMSAPGEAAAFDTIDQILAEYEQEQGITMAESQKEAVRCVMLNKVSILTGGPGTGKTTTTKAILYCHKKLFEVSVPILLSPTGKAARRMAESTGYPASTIHSGLKIGMAGGDNEDDDDNSPDDMTGTMLEGNLVIVDEASMADQHITSELLHCVPSGARIVFVGDPDQLPSVGYGNVLFQLLRSRTVPSVKLSVIFRQAESNPIVALSQAVNRGDSAMVTQWLQDVQAGKRPKSFSIRKASSAPETFRAAANLYIQAVRKYGMESTVLLCPFRKSTAINVNLFNVQLQAALNPKREGELTMKGKPLFVNGKSTPLEFRKGDKIMMTVNTNQARNGDTGYIRDVVKVVDPNDKTRFSVVAKVEFNGDGIIHEMDAEQIRDLDLAYCCTVHKSQGSEYQNVIMVMTMAHKLMLQRKLFYTAITRAKQNVLLVGEEEAVAYAIENADEEKRYTLLGDWLHTELPEVL